MTEEQIEREGTVLWVLTVMCLALAIGHWVFN